MTFGVPWTIGQKMLNLSSGSLETTMTNDFTITRTQYTLAIDNINSLRDLCHGSAAAAGWWDNERNVGEMLCLIHSEISEAMEAHRRSAVDDKLTNHPGIAVELADALIRIFDLAGGLRLDLGLAFTEKLRYNQTRHDHKRDVRSADGGKKY